MGCVMEGVHKMGSIEKGRGKIVGKQGAKTKRRSAKEGTCYVSAQGSVGSHQQKVITEVFLSKGVGLLNFVHTLPLEGGVKGRNDENRRPMNQYQKTGGQQISQQVVPTREADLEKAKGQSVTTMGTGNWGVTRP